MGTPKFNRWVALISGMLMMMISGTIYLFPGYSAVLKAKLGYSVEQIDFVGTLLNAGTWGSVFGGLFYDKFGPRLTTIGGSAMICVGYLAMHFSAAGLISTHYVVMAIFAFIVGQGSGWTYTVALNTNTANFTGEDRGKIVGLLACCFGLCSGIFTLIYKTFYFDDVVPFLLMLAIVLPIVALVTGFFFINFLTEYPKTYQSQVKRIYIGYGIMVAVAVWISISSLVTNFTSAGPFAFCMIMFAIIAALFLLPIGTPEGILLSSPAQVQTNDYENLLPSDTESVSVSILGGSYNLLQAIQTVEFWLLFFSHFAIIGSGITLLNNMAEIVMSREYPVHNGEVFPSMSALPHAKYATTFIIMFSVCNTLGRLAVGMFSDQFLHRLSRPAWLCIVAVLMSLTQVYYIFASIPMIFGGVIIHGLAYGGCFAVVPTLTVELFGFKYFGAIFGFVGLAPAIGSQLISTMLAGKLNDHYKQTDYIMVGDEKQCYGTVCFRYTMLITFALCICAIFTSFVLKMRYQRTNTKQIQEDQQ